MLIDDDGVLNAVHDDILESDGGSGEDGGVVVALDSCAVGGALAGAVDEGEVLHAQLIGPLPQAPNSQAVPGPAFQVLYVHVGAAGADGHAVVARSDGGVDDVHVGGIAQVDSVGVGAVFGGSDRHPGYLHSHAVDHFAVESHCVQQFYVAYVAVGGRLERKTLSNT